MFRDASVLELYIFIYVRYGRIVQFREDELPLKGLNCQ